MDRYHSYIGLIEHGSQSFTNMISQHNNPSYTCETFDNSASTHLSVDEQFTVLNEMINEDYIPISTDDGPIFISKDTLDTAEILLLTDTEHTVNYDGDTHNYTITDNITYESLVDKIKHDLLIDPEKLISNLSKLNSNLDKAVLIKNLTEMSPGDSNRTLICLGIKNAMHDDIVGVFTGGAYNSEEDKVAFSIMNNIFLPSLAKKK